MSSTAFSALREAYENDSFCRGCRAITLAGRDFETHSTILPVLLFFFLLCKDFLTAGGQICVVSVELVIFNYTSPTPGDAWPAFIANKLYTLSVPEDANDFTNGCNPKVRVRVRVR